MADKAQSNYSVAITTCASAEEAKELATVLLEQKLAACVQVVDITSFYTWKGEIANDAEKLLLIKTRTALYGAVEAALKSRHSYEIPEIIQVPVTAGLPAYLGWVDEVTEGSQSSGGEPAS